MGAAAGPAPATTKRGGLWGVYNNSLRGATYIDLTHRLTPQIPVWKGFGPSFLLTGGEPGDGRARTRYAKDGFEATLLPALHRPVRDSARPAGHWAPQWAAIDELPPTFAIRPLVVISIVRQVKKNFNYHL